MEEDWAWLVVETVGDTWLCDSLLELVNRSQAFSNRDVYLLFFFSFALRHKRKNSGGLDCKHSVSLSILLLRLGNSTPYASRCLLLGKSRCLRGLAWWINYVDTLQERLQVSRFHVVGYICTRIIFRCISTYRLLIGQLCNRVSTYHNFGHKQTRCCIIGYLGVWWILHVCCRICLQKRKE